MKPHKGSLGTWQEDSKMYTRIVISLSQKTKTHEEDKLHTIDMNKFIWQNPVKIQAIDGRTLQPCKCQRVTAKVMQGTVFVHRKVSQKKAQLRIWEGNAEAEELVTTGRGGQPQQWSQSAFKTKMTLQTLSSDERPGASSTHENIHFCTNRRESCSSKILFLLKIWFI